MNAGDNFEEVRQNTITPYAFGHTWFSPSAPNPPDIDTIMSYGVGRVEPWFSTVRVEPNRWVLGIAGERENERALREVGLGIAVDYSDFLTGGSGPPPPEPPPPPGPRPTAPDSLTVHADRFHQREAGVGRPVGQRERLRSSRPATGCALGDREEAARRHRGGRRGRARERRPLRLPGPGVQRQRRQQQQRRDRRAGGAGVHGLRAHGTADHLRSRVHGQHVHRVPGQERGSDREGRRPGLRTRFARIGGAVLLRSGQTPRC